MRITFIALTLTILASSSALAQSQGASLYISDFENTDNDATLSWLPRGMAEMMVTTMNRLSQFEVVNTINAADRVTIGKSDLESAFQRAERNRAQYLIRGAFHHERGVISIEAGLYDVARKEELVLVTWNGLQESLNEAPLQVTEQIIHEIDHPPVSGHDPRLAYFLPPSLSVAESYFRGRQAFDDGRYPEALVHYEAGAHDAGTFIPIHDHLIRLHTLNETPNLSADYALQTARKLRPDHLSYALQFYYTAAELFASSLQDTARSIDLLMRIDSLAVANEKITGDAAAMKQSATEKALRLLGTKFGTVSAVLRSPEIRHMLWTSEIDEQVQSKEQQAGYHWFSRNNGREKERLPGVTPGMWRIRALLMLGRLSVRQGDIDRGLSSYRSILASYDFLRQWPGYSEDDRIYWIHDIRLEAHFMILYHHKQTGEMIRDPILMPRVNVVDGKQFFMREYEDMTPDPRARVWSRREDGGHEYFDFIAPPGYQIDAIVTGAHVDGLAKCTIYTADPQGWPPQYDFSKRQEQQVWYSGTYSERVELPEGTEFVSCSVLWGDRWVTTPWEWLRRNASRLWGGKQDISWWEARFVISPKYGNLLVEEEDTVEVDRRMIRSYVTRFGWDDGSVIRQENAASYSGGKELNWTAIEVGGDIRLVSLEDTEFQAALPIMINTKGMERKPQLFSNPDGTNVLVWERPHSDENQSIFFSETSDFINWSIPIRMRFTDPEDPLPRYVSPYTSQIVTTPDGYLMSLDQGYVRRSADMRQWNAPVKLFQHDGQSLVLTGRNGVLWAIGTQYINELVPENEPIDPMFGYYVTGDGKRYKKGNAITVSRSRDGRAWSRENVIRIGKEGSGLWAFPRDDDRIIIAAGYHNLDMIWITAGIADYQIVDDLSVRLMTSGTHPRFFIRNNTLYCLRVVRDFRREQDVLLLQRSDEVYNSVYR